MGKNNNKVISGTLIYKQFIQLEDGTEIRVRYNQKPELYAGTDVQLYEYQAKEGRGDDAVIVTKYAVPFEQALRSSRTTVKQSVTAMLSQGLTAEEIVAKLAS